MIPTSQVVLHVDHEVGSILARMLRTAQQLPDGARVVDHLPQNPWGDLDVYSRAVHDPLNGLSVTEQPDKSSDLEVVVPADDVSVLRSVLDALAESISGAVPWIALTRPEQQVVARVLAQVDVGSADG